MSTACPHLQSLPYPPRWSILTSLYSNLPSSIKLFSLDPLLQIQSGPLPAYQADHHTHACYTRISQHVVIVTTLHTFLEPLFPSWLLTNQTQTICSNLSLRGWGWAMGLSGKHFLSMHKSLVDHQHHIKLAVVALPIIPMLEEKDKKIRSPRSFSGI